MYPEEKNWNLKIMYEQFHIELIDELNLINSEANRIWIIEDDIQTITNEISKDNIILQEECEYPYISSKIYTTLLDKK